MKLKHRITGKIYECCLTTTYINPEPPKVGDKAYVRVRTNFEVEDQRRNKPRKWTGARTQYYVEEPLSDFEMIEE